MARHKREGAERIYEVHRRWMEDALMGGGSLLTPGEPIWTVAHLEELDGIFDDVAHESKGTTFIEKLHAQLAPLSSEAVQLMAELHIVHFLAIHNGAISAATKVSTIEAILSWMPNPVSLTQDMAEAMAPGVAHPGQWVLTRRDIQLAWMIRFALAFKGESPELQRRLIGDPWELKAFTERLQDTQTEGARLALLHLAHPDTIDPILSPNHRQLIIDRFGHLAPGEDDVDRALLAIRAELTEEYGEGFHWYLAPVSFRWQRTGKPWQEMLEWLQRLRSVPEIFEGERSYKLEIAGKISHARELVCAGDDGWYGELKQSFGHKGNNYTAFQDHGRLLEWMDSNRDDGLAALRALWEDGDAPGARIDACFDAVPATVLSALGGRLNIASFLLMGEDPSAFPLVKISVLRKAMDLAGWEHEGYDATPGELYEHWLVFLDELVCDSQDWDEPLEDRLDAQTGTWTLIKAGEKPAPWDDATWQRLLEFRGDAEQPPGGSPGPETDPPGQVEPVDHIAKAAKELHVDRSVLDEIVELLDNKRQVILYGPPGTGKTFLGMRLAKAIAHQDPSRVALVQFHPATSYEDFIEGLRPRVTDAGHVTYERVPGPLITMAEAAAADSDRPYVLVVDEINRANLPKVFGELLFLLEHRKESARILYRPQEPFSLPDNLLIIGTMNTADRSVALIDAAMRRRFHFVPFFPHRGAMRGLLRRWLEDGGGRLDVADLLDAVNAELEGLVGEHLLIGPSHFIQSDLSDRALERIWTYNVFPLIEEQVWGDRAEIDRWRWAAVRERHGATLTGQVAAADPVASDEGGDDGAGP